ncbi:MAG TPA: biotin/lipoyl-containing protein, partial [Longimicrobiales bacterium]|nr:biotin/lipoyl-containing protein [Longimicrobiales bacterium]
MARVDVPMPQMGESIAEGTVSKWLKKVGDTVGRDEPLLEISTDKVDAEIPSPSAGTLVEIKVQEGTTVEVGSIVAVIDTEAKAGAAAPAPAPEKPAPEKAAPAPEAPQPEQPAPAAGKPAAATAPAPAGGNGDQTAEERLKTKSTPLVRKIAAEHNVDIGQLQGSGYAGRVTKNDIISYIEKSPSAAPGAKPQPAPSGQPAPARSTPPASGDFWTTFYHTVQHPEFPAREGDKLVAMDRVRKLTADHMVRAKRVAPHVHSFIEIDFTQIDKVRKKNAS